MILQKSFLIPTIVETFVLWIFFLFYDELKVQKYNTYLK